MKGQYIKDICLYGLLRDMLFKGHLFIMGILRGHMFEGHYICFIGVKVLIGNFIKLLL